MKNHKVRFNLSRGENYMKWQIMYNDGRVEYHHPAEVQIIMTGCTLKNRRTVAEKIYTGATTKVVCAWVTCNVLELRTENFIKDNDLRIRYNPRKHPYWEMEGENLDGKNYEKIFSVDYGLYLVK